ncbi:MAG: hypothetical protein H5U12_18210 [Hoeflea sp.]|nr:hypothetical protein [Hoeflea sp.]
MAGISVPLTLASLTLVQAAGCPERPSCEGCGCKGGPGYRIDATGKCVGYKALKAKCGDPPTLRCTFENAPGTGLNKDCALGRTAKEPD